MPTKPRPPGEEPSHDEDDDHEEFSSIMAAPRVEHDEHDEDDDEAPDQVRSRPCSTRTITATTRDVAEAEAAEENEGEIEPVTAQRSAPDGDIAGGRSRGRE